MRLPCGQLNLRKTPILKSSRVGLTTAVALCLLGSGLSGCVYRMSIQQGNFLEHRTVDQLQVGMTRSQVRYLLGTPMIPATFDKDRWDYLYYFKRGRIKEPVERRLTVYFKEDKVARFEKDNMPDAAPDAEKPDQAAPIEKFPKI
jgi:outer membrane protein assembly factor BamE